LCHYGCRRLFAGLQRRCGGGAGGCLGNYVLIDHDVPDARFLVALIFGAVGNTCHNAEDSYDDYESPSVFFKFAFLFGYTAKLGAGIEVGCQTAALGVLNEYDEYQ